MCRSTYVDTRASKARLHRPEAEGPADRAAAAATRRVVVCRRSRPGAASSCCPPTLALSLAALHIDCTHGGKVSSGAKRKAAAACSTGHWGLSSDSALAVRLIAISRVVRSKDESILTTAAAAPAGVAFLSALRAAVLRVALAVGGADRALNEVGVAALFNLAGSCIASQRAYDSGMSLPARLPWERAKALLAALLDSLAAIHREVVGLRVGNELLLGPANPPDAAGSALIAEVIAAVEADMTARLSGGGSASASSSSSSRSTPPPPPLPPPPLPMPLPSLPSLPSLPAAHEHPFVVDPTQSLSANVRHLVEHRVRRPLSAAEFGTIHAALGESLSSVSAACCRRATPRREQASSHRTCWSGWPIPARPMWACCLESAEADVHSIAALAGAIVENCTLQQRRGSDIRSSYCNLIRRRQRGRDAAIRSAQAPSLPNPTCEGGGTAEEIGDRGPSAGSGLAPSVRASSLLPPETSTSPCVGRIARVGAPTRAEGQN